MKLKWLITVIALIALSVILDLILLRENGELVWTYIPGFFAVFGLIGALAVIVISRLLGRYWLERREDYYHKADDDD